MGFSINLEQNIGLVAPPEGAGFLPYHPEGTSKNSDICDFSKDSDFVTL